MEPFDFQILGNTVKPYLISLGILSGSTSAMLQGGWFAASFTLPFLKSSRRPVSKFPFLREIFIFEAKWNNGNLGAKS